MITNDQFMGSNQKTEEYSAPRIESRQVVLEAIIAASAEPELWGTGGGVTQYDQTPTTGSATGNDIFIDPY
jgi:hypothetical protein